MERRDPRISPCPGKNFPLEILILEPMWKGNYQSTDNTKYGKGKTKLLPKIEETSGEKAHTNTRKLTQNILTVRQLSQSKNSKCM